MPGPIYEVDMTHDLRDAITHEHDRLAAFPVRLESDRDYEARRKLEAVCREITDALDAQADRVFTLSRDGQRIDGKRMTLTFSLSGDVESWEKMGPAAAFLVAGELIRQAAIRRTMG